MKKSIIVIILIIITVFLLTKCCEVSRNVTITKNTENKGRDHESMNRDNVKVSKVTKFMSGISSYETLNGQLTICYKDLKEEAQQITMYEFDVDNTELIRLIQSSTLYDNKKSSILLPREKLCLSKYIISLKSLGIMTIDENECDTEGYLIRYDKYYWERKELYDGKIHCWQSIYLNETKYAGYGDSKIMDRVDNPEEIVYNMYKNLNQHIEENGY